jgi:hypothetical protein
MKISQCGDGSQPAYSSTVSNTPTCRVEKLSDFQ